VEDAMTEPFDFPAAHSMDTTWFAVDRDGHVAVFETGESGAVPTAAYLGEDYGEVEDALRSALPRGRAVFHFESRKEAGPSHLAPSEAEGPWSILLFVRDASEVRDLLEASDVDEVLATTGVGLVAWNIDQSVLRAIHDRGACLGCFLYYADEEKPNLAELGLFQYDEPHGGWASAYPLSCVPQSPVHVDALPRAVLTKMIRYDGRFAETLRLQPAELWRCESWVAGWLALDGKTVRPFPGREKEYRGERDRGDGLVHLETAEAKPDAQPVLVAPAKKPWWRLW
jgi:hypothetical protein